MTCPRVLLICTASIGSLGLPSGCTRRDVDKQNSSTQATPYFREVTLACGLPGPTQNWPAGTFATPETTAGGVAFLDYDNDGRLDILQICHGPPGHLDDPTPSRLFHQEVNGSFREVPGAGGLINNGYGHGVAVGDFDNDGFPDVFITNFGHDHLYRNNRDGTFTDVTAAAGIDTAHSLWSSSATWVDYDRDGYLDLLVVHFATFDPTRKCPGDDGKPDYCGPSQFTGAGCTLYHNNHDGTFTDVTKKAGIDYPGRGWGVIAIDVNDDGYPDLFVANDEERQNLYINQRDGTFKDESIERGVAYSGMGSAEAGMGVTAGDILNDGRCSLLISHIRGEKNTLYMPRGAAGIYVDKSAASGMASAGLKYTGWGCGFFDFDNDGCLDLAVANGGVARQTPNPLASLGPFWNAYADQNLLFRGDGTGKFTNASAQAGDFVSRAENTRGLAVGDFDNDGHIDLVSNTIDNTLRLYRNVTPAEGKHWLLVSALLGKRDALGAKLHLKGGDKQWTRIVQSGYSFESSNDPRAHFGLGKTDKLDGLEVRWPSGTPEFERFEVPGIDRIITIRQGEGKAIAAPNAPTAQR